MTGTVKGNELTINFKVNAQGADLAITYIGTVEGDTDQGQGDARRDGRGDVYRQEVRLKLNHQLTWLL